MLGAIIGAAGNLIGGYMGQKNQQKMAEQNIALQKEFAQSGIQWKVEDAKKAGINPYYALGAQTSSFSPVSVGEPLAAGIAGAGQDLSRAFNSTMSPSSRSTAFQSAMQELTLEKAGLENSLLRSQISRMNQTPNPGLPTASQQWLIDGQGQTALSNTSVPGTLISDGPLKRSGVNPVAPHQEVGALSDIGYARTASNGWAPLPSADVKNRIEDNLIQELVWTLRNQALPTLQMNKSPPFKAPEGQMWVYHPVLQEYRLTPTWSYYGGRTPHRVSGETY